MHKKCFIETLPDWLYSTETSLGQGAYQSFSAELRAELKKQIAFVYNVFHAGRPDLKMQELEPLDGCSLSVEYSTSTWTLLLVPDNYPSATRFLAAAVPCIATKPEHFIICRYSHNKSESMAEVSPQLSAACELAGIELVFDVNATQLHQLMQFLASAPGRIVCLGQEGMAFATAAMQSSIPFMLLKSPENAALYNFTSDNTALDSGFDVKLFAWANPDVRVSPLATDSSTLRLKHCSECSHDATRATDVLLLSGDAPRTLAGALAEGTTLFPLVLGAGQESLWLWPQLGKEFFTERSLRLTRS